MKPAPDWLAELQAELGAVLRTPLDRSTGTLRSTATGGLAVYNRQYWFRLFGVMQTAYPLVARLLGHWDFNEVATRFLLAHPPRGWDLEDAAHGFAAFLAETVPDQVLLAEAATIDAAWRRVFRAPAVVPFRPGPEDAANLADTQLVASPESAVLVEHWPLVELKASLAGDGGDSRVARPPALDSPRSWVFLRESAGIRRHVLEPRESELLLLLQRHTVREALARLEMACTESERATLPARAQRWLAQSVARGLWIRG